MQAITKKSPAIWLLLLLVGFPQISETIYSPALPNIAHSLLTSNSLVQWTLSIYFIGFAFGVFSWGSLSDHIGRRKAMLSGLAIYIVATIFCFNAHSIDELLIFRLIQGLGASCGSVLTQAIVRESLTDKKRHHFFSMVGFVLAFAITLGPFIGGYLTQWFAWRANFIFLTMMGAVLLVLAIVKLPETRLVDHQQTPAKFLSIAKRLLADKHVLASAIIVAAINGILFSYYAEGPFILIKLVGLSSSQYGWLGIFIAIAALVGSLISKPLGQMLAPQKMMLIGIAIMLVSSVAFILLTLTFQVSSADKVASSIVILVPMMGLILGGFGFLIPATLGHALLNYKEVLGRAGALFGLGYYLLTSLFTWVMGYINNGKAITMPIYFLALSCVILLAFFCGISRIQRA